MTIDIVPWDRALKSPVPKGLAKFWSQDRNPASASNDFLIVALDGAGATQHYQVREV